MKHETKEVDYKLLRVTSTVFNENELIPSYYTCDGINVNPPLDIEDIPEEAKCLSVIVDDPDAPIHTWSHWLVWNIPVTHHIKENCVLGTEGLNDFLQHHYSGPCPPSGIHRYFFKVYALNELLNLSSETKKIQLEKAMSEYIIGFGEMIGLYKRNKEKH